MSEQTLTHKTVVHACYYTFEVLMYDVFFTKESMEIKMPNRKSDYLNHTYWIG